MKKYFSCLAAILLVAICYIPARLPTLSPFEMTTLASRFSFKKFPLPEVSGHLPYKSVRQVHPSLERISAWISSIGAAVSLGDLDGDGLPNDLVYVDPRTDLVTVTPAPNTGERYKPFALNASFWSHNSYDLSTIAPTGTVIGDFNEDGLLDIMVYFWGRTPILYLRNTSVSTKSQAVAGVPASLSEKQLSARDFVPQELIDSGERWYSDCATQADLDGDGHVDLLVANYFQDGARILDPKAGGTDA